LLLSASADGTVKLWKEFDFNLIEESVQKNTNDSLLGSFTYRPLSQQTIEIPTSTSWIHTSSNSLLISYLCRTIGIFDRITGKNKGVMKIDHNPILSNAQQQINQVISHKTKPLAIAAMENKLVRLFDINSGKVLH
jgi:WD40 repeat protein